MTERTIFETVTDAEAEADLGGFADSDILVELRAAANLALPLGNGE
jgi:hypothetical protein